MALQKSVTAIDVGSAGLKVLEIRVDRGRILITRAGRQQFEEAPDTDPGATPDELTVSSALSGLLTRLGTSPKKLRNVISCTPGAQVGIKQITTMKLSDDELRSSLIFEARKHMPVKGEVLLDYQVARTHEDTLDVLLVATSRGTVEAHLSMLERCGVKPGVIDAPALAATNAWLLSDAAARGKSFVIINIGAAVTTLCYSTPSGEFFTRDIPIAGRQFTEEIRRSTGCSWSEAEQQKLQNGIANQLKESSNTGDTKGLSLSLAGEDRNTAIDNLTREIQRSLRFFVKETGSAETARVLVCGGSAGDSRLLKHLERELRTPVERFDPLSNFEPNVSIEENDRPRYAQALGMALRRIHDLFPDQLKSAGR